MPFQCNNQTKVIGSKVNVIEMITLVKSSDFLYVIDDLLNIYLINTFPV